MQIGAAVLVYLLTGSRLRPPTVHSISTAEQYLCNLKLLAACFWQAASGCHPCYAALHATRYPVCSRLRASLARKRLRPFRQGHGEANVPSQIPSSILPLSASGGSGGYCAQCGLPSAATAYIRREMKWERRTAILRSRRKTFAAKR